MQKSKFSPWVCSRSILKKGLNTKMIAIVTRVMQRYPTGIAATILRLSITVFQQDFTSFWPIETTCQLKKSLVAIAHIVKTEFYTITTPSLTDAKLTFTVLQWFSTNLKLDFQL